MAAARQSIAFASLVLFSFACVAATDAPVVTLTPRQEKSLDAVYFNCDHEGELGCLRQACRRATKRNAIEIQYLYRGTFGNFPELLTPDLKACFVRAGGRFR